MTFRDPDPQKSLKIQILLEQEIKFTGFKMLFSLMVLLTQ